MGQEPMYEYVLQCDIKGNAFLPALPLNALSPEHGFDSQIFLFFKELFTLKNDFYFSSKNISTRVVTLDYRKNTRSCWIDFFPPPPLKVQKVRFLNFVSVADCRMLQLALK